MSPCCDATLTDVTCDATCDVTAAGAAAAGGARPPRLHRGHLRGGEPGRALATLRPPLPAGRRDAGT